MSDDTLDTPEPHGEVTMQTIAMPADTNANGDIFGGWLLAQMDLAGGVLAKKISNGRAVTVAIESITFLEPVKVGDLVSCYVELLKIGRTSMTVQVEVWINCHQPERRARVTGGTMIYVAVDDNGRKRTIRRP